MSSFWHVDIYSLNIKNLFHQIKKYKIKVILVDNNKVINEDTKIAKSSNKLFISGFDLMTHDSYFTILVEVFTNHILAEKTYFTNHTE